MSQLSKLRQSRDQWKHKARARADDNRYLRKQLARVKQERDSHHHALKQAQARLDQQGTQRQGLAVQHKTDLVFLALQLFLVARIGFRAVSRVLTLLSEALGIQRAPCPQTIINWVTRLSLVRMQSAASLAVAPLGQAPFAKGVIWMLDSSIGLGAGKMLTVLALDARHHQLHPAAPSLPHVHCIAVAVAASWTGETIANFLQRVIAVVGRPAAYLKDGGSDLQKAVRLLGERGLASPAIDDISHVVANLLKRHYQHHPGLATFLSACASVSGRLKQTMLACLAPPNVHSKARFMNLHRLVTWAERLLRLAPVGRAPQGGVLTKLHACLDRLPACQALIQRFREDAVPLLECQKILKTQGLRHDTLRQCEPLVEAIASSAVRRGFTTYLKAQLETATQLGLAGTGLPISSDPIESLFGLAKQHGVGAIKDANQIATRLPTLCATPTRAEAQQVLDIRVAQQQALTVQLNSLTKQRREVLPNPNRLERLGMDQANHPIELIPCPKNRSNNPEIINISISCKEASGPNLKPPDHYSRPAGTVP